MGRSRHVSRRRFLKGSALASASALSILPAAKSAPSQQSQRQPSRVSTFFDLIRPPDFITATSTLLEHLLVDPRRCGAVMGLPLSSSLLLRHHAVWRSRFPLTNIL